MTTVNNEIGVWLAPCDEGANRIGFTITAKDDLPSLIELQANKAVMNYIASLDSKQELMKDDWSGSGFLISTTNLNNGERVRVIHKSKDIFLAMGYTCGDVEVKKEVEWIREVCGEEMAAEYETRQVEDLEPEYDQQE